MDYDAAKVWEEDRVWWFKRVHHLISELGTESWGLSFAARQLEHDPTYSETFCESYCGQLDRIGKIWRELHALRPNPDVGGGDDGVGRGDSGPDPSYKDAMAEAGYYVRKSGDSDWELDGESEYESEYGS